MDDDDDRPKDPPIRPPDTAQTEDNGDQTRRNANISMVHRLVTVLMMNRVQEDKTDDGPFEEDEGISCWDGGAESRTSCEDLQAGCCCCCCWMIVDGTWKNESVRRPRHEDTPLLVVADNLLTVGTTNAPNEPYCKSAMVKNQSPIVDGDVPILLSHEKCQGLFRDMDMGMRNVAEINHV